MDFEFIDTSANPLELDIPELPITIKEEKNPLLIEVDVGYIGELSSQNNCAHRTSLDERIENPITMEEAPSELELLLQQDSCENLIDFECDELVLGNFVKEEAPDSDPDPDMIFDSTKMYKCNDCDKAYSSPGALKTHRDAEHNGQAGWECPICGKIIKYKGDLKRHILRHTDSRSQHDILKCKNCDFQTKRKSEYIKHNCRHKIKRGSPTELDKTQSCEECGKKYGSITALKNHMDAEHSGQGPFKCSLCDIHIKYRGDMKRHMARHMYSDKDCKLFKCKICHFQSGSKVALIDHNRTHPELQKYQSQSKFKCNECDKEYSSTAALKIHWDVEHSEEGPYQCGICGRYLKYKGNLNAHMLSHSKPSDETLAKPEPIPEEIVDDFDEISQPEEEDEFSYDLCDEMNESVILENKRSREEQQQSKRKQNATSKIKFCCDDCDKVYASISALKNHQDAEHSGEGPSVCPICEKRIKYKGDLKRHIQTHSDVKTFRCRVCGFKSKTNDSLRAHKRRHGIFLRKRTKPEKTFKCGDCDRAYASNGALKMHIKAEHSDEPPICCPICGVTMKYKGDLKRHMKRHEN